MPNVVQLPTRRKEEKAHAPVTQKVKNPQKKSKIPGCIRPKVKSGKVRKQTIDLVKPSKNGTHGTAPTRSNMRSAEIETLEGIIGRVEIADFRGRKPKPALQITKGELEALTLGIEILQTTVKQKKV